MESRPFHQDWILSKIDKSHGTRSVPTTNPVISESLPSVRTCATCNLSADHLIGSVDPVGSALAPKVLESVPLPY